MSRSRATGGSAAPWPRRRAPPAARGPSRRPARSRSAPRRGRTTRAPQCTTGSDGGWGEGVARVRGLRERAGLTSRRKASTPTKQVTISLNRAAMVREARRTMRAVGALFGGRPSAQSSSAMHTILASRATRATRSARRCFGSREPAGVSAVESAATGAASCRIGTAWRAGGCDGLRRWGLPSGSPGATARRLGDRCPRSPGKRSRRAM